jgi:hypothetical protein
MDPGWMWIGPNARAQCGVKLAHGDKSTSVAQKANCSVMPTSSPTTHPPRMSETKCT